MTHKSKGYADELASQLIQLGFRKDGLRLRAKSNDRPLSETELGAIQAVRDLETMIQDKLTEVGNG